MLILVANPKGGVGKSTIAAHAAVRTALMGHSVVLADADPQGTSRHWARRRARERPSAPGVATEAIGDDMAGDLAALARRFRHTIVDTPPAATPDLKAALVDAHRVIVPSRVASRDIEALQRMADLVDNANGERTQPIRPRVVFNFIRALPNFWKRVDEARSQVESMGLDVCPRAIVDRLIYDDCQRDGGTVFDDRWDRKAVEEINAVLYDQLRNPQMGERLVAP